MRIYRKRIERITIIGVMDESEKALVHCLENNYLITRSGPKPMASFRYDTSKFKIVAEKEIADANCTD